MAQPVTDRCATTMSRVACNVLALSIAMSAVSGICRAEGAPRDHLTADEIRAELVGRPISGIYTDGVAWSELLQPDGRTVLKEEGRSLPGRWFFERGSELCFTYDDGEPGDGCYRFVRLGRNCYEHFMPPETNPDASWPDGWETNGMVWRTDEVADCPDRPST